MTRVRLFGVLALLAALGLGGLAWWLSEEFEFRQEMRAIPWQGEAASNPYLAARRLLERYGAQVGTPLRYGQLPPAGATLVLPQSRADMSPREAMALNDWVDAGGELVVVVRAPSAGSGVPDDPLLNGLGVRGEYLDGADASSEEPLAPPQLPGAPNAPAAPIPRPAPAPCGLALPDGSGVLHLGGSALGLVLSGRHVLIWQLDDCGRTRAARFSRGRGKVTVLGDSNFMRSRQLGHLDHAGYLVWLLDPRPGRTIWIVQGGASPPLWQRLYAALPAMCIGALLLLVTALWRAGPAPGPRLPAPAGARRSLLEHVGASARLLWQADRGALLYHTLRENLLRRAVLRHPTWSSLPEGVLAQRAALLTGLPEAQVVGALAAHNLRHPDDFIRDFRTLETLRKLL